MLPGKCSGRETLLMTSLMITTITGPSLERPFNYKLKSFLLYWKSGMCVQSGSCVALLFSAEQCFLHSGPKRASSKNQKHRSDRQLAYFVIAV